MEYARILSDNWEDAGKIYKVREYARRNPESTAAHLTIELEDGRLETKVIPYHWIEWLENGE